MSIVPRHKGIRALWVGGLIYLIGGFPTLLFALPQGGEIAAGSGAIEQPTAQDMVIHQNTGEMILNWEGFSIGASESVTFRQPGADSVALNRVIGADPSLILGRLSANGQVFISNPSGVIFGPGSRVDVHGLLATTLKISDQDFLNGQYRFYQDPDRPLSSILNEGLINVSGYAGLLAPGVENRGTIVANLGSIALASGTAATLDFTGDGLINFTLTGEVSGTVVDAEGNVVEDRVSNSGLLRADGGQVMMGALDAGEVIRNVINQSGVVEARTVVEKEGRIFLSGGDQGDVRVSGVLDASGDEPGEIGGTVDVTGEKVGLFDQAVVDVSGEAGGGQARIGGDVHGEGSLPSAFRTFVGPDTVIQADARTAGDGGRVIVWADDVARVYGTLSARGGEGSGDGGFIETSGKNQLDILRTPDVRAPQGQAGEWLLDPYNITIVAGSLVFNINSESPFVSSGESSELGVNLILDALAGGATVTVETGSSGVTSEPGDIVLDTDLDFDGTGNGTLNLIAANDVIFNQSIFDSDTTTADTLSLFIETGTLGQFSLAAGESVNTEGDFFFGLNLGLIDILAGDIDLQGTLDSGTAFTTLRTFGTLGVGDATCGEGCGLTLSNAELQNLATPSLFLGDSGTGDIFLENITSAATSHLPRISFTSSGNIQFVNDPSIFNGRVDLNAQDDIHVNAAFEASGGLGIFAVADSDADGVGDFRVGAAGSVLSNNTRVSVLANDLDLLGTVDSGSGSMTFRVSDHGTIGLGAADCTEGCGMSLSGSELQNLTSASLTVGGSANDGVFVDGVGPVDIADIDFLTLVSDAADGMISFSGSSSTFRDLTLFAGNGIDIATAVTVTGGTLQHATDPVNPDTGLEFGTFLADADRDQNGTGTFYVGGPSSSVVHSGDGTLFITADDLVLHGILDSGLGTTQIGVNDGGTLGLGNAAGDMQISNSELDSIFAGLLQIGATTRSGAPATGNITVDNVASASTDQITRVLLVTEGTSSVAFSGSASTFNALSVDSASGVTVDAALTGVNGGMDLQAGSSITVNAPVTTQTAGDIDLDAVEDVVFNAGGGLNAAGDIFITADSDGDGTGGLVMNPGSSLTTTASDAFLQAGENLLLAAIDLTGGLFATSTLGSITTDGIVNAPDGVTLEAATGVTINEDMTTSNGILIDTDSNDDGLGGGLVIGSGATLDTNNTPMAAAFESLTLDGFLDTGLANLGFTTANDFTVAGTLVERIIAQQLGVISSSDIFVESITPAQISGIPGGLVLDAGGNIIFQNLPVTVPSIEMNSDEDTNVNTNVTTTSGDFVAVADDEGNEQGDFNLADGTQINSAGNIDLSGANVNTSQGTLTAAGDVIVNGEILVPPAPEPPPETQEQVDQGTTSTFITEFFENPQTAC